jgi:GMP synthase (glutamine-hydrolysing)
LSRIAVVKAGSTYPGLAEQQGDFEAWIVAGLGLDREAVAVVDVCEGEALPAFDGLAGAVVSGSHTSVIDHEPWSEVLARWLAGAVGHGLPLLGICYGHQLLAYALGGEVRDNPRGLEFGTVPIHLTAAAAADPLFGGLPATFPAQVCHSQTVVRLPAGARRLAWSERDSVQAFAVGPRAWGVQFHPEFDRTAVRYYIGAFRDGLVEQRDDPGMLAASCGATPEASGLLKRFATWVQAPA